MKTTSPRCIVYRTGGTENFAWKRSLAMPYEVAMARTIEMKRMGYVAHTADYALSLAIGLPETFDAADTLSLT